MGIPVYECTPELLAAAERYAEWSLRLAREAHALVAGPAHPAALAELRKIAEEQEQERLEV